MSYDLVSSLEHIFCSTYELLPPETQDYFWGGPRVPPNATALSPSSLFVARARSWILCMSKQSVPIVALPCSSGVFSLVDLRCDAKRTSPLLQYTDARQKYKR